MSHSPPHLLSCCCPATTCPAAMRPTVWLSRCARCAAVLDSVGLLLLIVGLRCCASCCT
jgi:hypothetical protein